MASEATPRVNARYLDSFTNQTVRILGKVVSLRGETATIDASGSINVHLNRVIHSIPTQSNRVEELGNHGLRADGKKTPMNIGKREGCNTYRVAKWLTRFSLGRTSPAQQRCRGRGQGPARPERQGVPGYGFRKHHWYDSYFQFL